MSSNYSNAQNLVIRLIGRQLLNNREDEELENESLILRRLINLRETTSNQGRNRNLQSTSTELISEEEFLTTLLAFMPHRNLETIRTVVNRVGPYDRNFQDNLINHYTRRSEERLREEPNNSRYYREDDIAESFDELLLEDENIMLNSTIDKINEFNLNIISNEYLDYKLYPYYISWEEINNYKSMAYEVMEKFGFLGCYIYTNLYSSDIKLKYFKLESELLNTSVKCFSDNNLLRFQNIVKALPSINQIKTIIEKLLVKEKEIILLKIILDLHEINLLFVSKNPSYSKIKEFDLFFETSLKFIKFLKTSIFSSEKEYKLSSESLYQRIKAKTQLDNSFSQLKKIFKIDFLKGIKLYNKRLIKLKETFDYKYKCLDNKDFII